MEQWEYLTKIMTAEATKKEIKQYLKDRLNVEKPARFTPEALLPQLNDLGAQGWELVQLDPVTRVNRKGKLFFANESWTNVYFCVFKRRKPGSSINVVPVNPGQTA